MKKVLLILLVLILVLAGYLLWIFKLKPGGGRVKGPEPVPLAVSKHSEAFNQSVQSLLDAYYDLTEVLVNWDSAVVNEKAARIKASLDSLKLDELKVDTTGIYESTLEPVSNSKNEIDNMINAGTLDAKRVAFNSLSENLRSLFLVVRYDRSKLYWQECPMAFGDETPGHWLSKSEAVRNPYLGTKHPIYHAGMLECGGPKDTINFVR